MDILNELKTLINKLDEENIDYALCGGLAMAVYARPRATLDIDILIEPNLLETVKRVTRDLGFTLAASPMELHGGKIRIHRISKVEENTAEILALDLLIVTPEIGKAWDDRVEVEWEHGTIKVVSPEGLILLKSFRKSGQDQDDIEYLRSIIDEA
jgi:acetolactate synthase regulatory subunit